MIPPAIQKLRYLRLSLVLGIAIAATKFVAYGVTGSVAVLTDAVEGLVNVAAAAFALYAVWLSARPADRQHPYGHGKIEFVSAGFEGGFIAVAGLGILYEAYRAIVLPEPPQALNVGLLWVSVGMLGNGALGWILLQAGKRHSSPALRADGTHLLSDAATSLGLILGLVLLHLTHLYWLDGAIALVLAALLLYHGGKLIRESLRGLMDERDAELIQEVASILEHQRRDTWVDLHNLRAVRHGADIHIDAHITLPWYLDLRRIEQELGAVEQALDRQFAQRIEVFLHPEACTPRSCPICPLTTCSVRQSPFQIRINWTQTALESHENHLPPHQA